MKTISSDTAENSIMQTITIAVSAILIASGLVTAPGLINNARDNNARTDLANIAYAQEFYLSTTGHYYDVDNTNTFLTIQQELDADHANGGSMTKAEAVNNLQYQAESVGLNGLGTSVAVAADDVAGVSFTLSGDVTEHGIETCRDEPYFLLKDHSASGKWFYRGSGSAAVSDNFDVISDGIPSKVLTACPDFGSDFGESTSTDDDDSDGPSTTDGKFYVTVDVNADADEISGYVNATADDLDPICSYDTYWYENDDRFIWEGDVVSTSYFDENDDLVQFAGDGDISDVRFSPNDGLLFVAVAINSNPSDPDSDEFFGMQQLIANGGEIDIHFSDEDGCSSTATFVYGTITGTNREWPWDDPRLFTDASAGYVVPINDDWTQQSTGGHNGLFSGASWSDFSEMEVSPDGETIVAMEAGALNISTDGGDTFNLVNCPAQSAVEWGNENCMYIEVTNSEIFVATTLSGNGPWVTVIHSSSDGGQTWEHRASPIANTISFGVYAEDFKVNASGTIAYFAYHDDPDTIEDEPRGYIGVVAYDLTTGDPIATYGVAEYDYDRATGLRSLNASSMAVYGNTLYVGTLEGRVYKKVGNGSFELMENLFALTENGDIRKFDFSNSGNTIAIAMGGVWSGGPAGIIISHDGGATWTQPSDIYGPVSSVAVSSDGQTIIIAKGNAGPYYHFWDSTVWVSEDGGNKWYPQETAIPTSYNSVANVAISDDASVAYIYGVSIYSGWPRENSGVWRDYL